MNILTDLNGLFPLLGYVGPGPGLSMTWALLGLAGTVFAALSALAIWPLRALVRRCRPRSPRETDHSTRSG